MNILFLIKRGQDFVYAPLGKWKQLLVCSRVIFFLCVLSAFEDFCLMSYRTMSTNKLSSFVDSTDPHEPRFEFKVHVWAAFLVWNRTTKLEAIEIVWSRDCIVSTVCILDKWVFTVVTTSCSAQCRSLQLPGCSTVGFMDGAPLAASYGFLPTLVEQWGLWTLERDGSNV